MKIEEPALEEQPAADFIYDMIRFSLMQLNEKEWNAC